MFVLLLVTRYMMHKGTRSEKKEQKAGQRVNCYASLKGCNDADSDNIVRIPISPESAHSVDNS